MAIFLGRRMIRTCPEGGLCKKRQHCPAPLQIEAGLKRLTHRGKLTFVSRQTQASLCTGNLRGKSFGAETLVNG